MLCTRAWLRGVLQGSAALLSVEEVSPGSCKPAAFPFSTPLPHPTEQIAFGVCAGDSFQLSPSVSCGQNKEVVNEQWDKMRLKEKEVHDHLLLLCL